jgi:hypothetical protein
MGSTRLDSLPLNPSFIMKDAAGSTSLGSGKLLRSRYGATLLFSSINGGHTSKDRHVGEPYRFTAVSRESMTDQALYLPCGVCSSLLIMKLTLLLSA